MPFDDGEIGSGSFKNMVPHKQDAGQAELSLFPGRHAQPKIEGRGRLWGLPGKISEASHEKPCGDAIHRHREFFPFVPCRRESLSEKPAMAHAVQEEAAQ